MNVFAVFNSSGEPARYVIAASGKVLAMSRIGDLWTVHRRADAVDYLDGEEPRA